jgi:hypothetical protein
MSIRSGPIGLRTRSRIAVLARSLAIGAALVGTVGYDAHAEDLLRLRAEAPGDQLIVGGKFGGYYYAAKPLKQEYDKLLLRVQSLRLEIVGGKISSQQAAGQVRELQNDLQRVRQLIETTKTFIAAGRISTKTETIEFELGPEGLLFLTGVPKVHLIGWDKPNVACVLEKTVVGDGDQPLDDHFAGIRLVHRHGAAKQEVGPSPEERRIDEEAFLASPDGKKLTPKQLKMRHGWMEKAFATQGYFRPFQSQAIDLLELEGLTYQQGNRQVSYAVMSRGGDGRGGTMWQRHAALTIYVPSCKAIGVRGGLDGLEVDGVKAPLTVRGDGDRDYDSHSYVKEHDGSLTIENIPLETIDGVQGNVSITVSADLGNSGTRHWDGQRAQYVELPASYNYRKIDGDFTALLLNVRLQLSEVSGRVDVTNEFGDTQFVVRTPLAAADHRVVSESGNITLQLAKDALENAPLIAVSECGTVRIAAGAPPLVDGNISYSPGSGLVLRRTYRGFATEGDAKSPSPRFDRFQRIESVFTREGQTPGLDVISRSGTVQIESVEN